MGGENASGIYLNSPFSYLLERIKNNFIRVNRLASVNGMISKAIGGTTLTRPIKVYFVVDFYRTFYIRKTQMKRREKNDIRSQSNRT